MTPAYLKAVVGTVAVSAAPILTGIVLSGAVTGAARDAAVMLSTLAWQHAGTVIRSLFPGPEIDVAPAKKDEP